MNFTKLSLKYRPQRFEDLVGQDSVVRALQGSFSNDRVSPSYLITGPWGSGKCITGESLVPTNRGIVPIHELIDHSKPQGFQSLDLGIFSRKGPYRTRRGFYESTSRTVKLETRIGLSQQATPEHKVLVMTPDGICFKKHEDIVVGDRIAVARGSDVWSTENYVAQGERLTEKMAWLLGALVANGGLSSGSTNFCTTDLSLLDSYITTFREVLGKDVVPHQDKRGLWHAKSALPEVREKLENFGLKYVASAEKNIPHSVLRSTRSVVLSFLEGYSNSDSGADDGDLMFCSASSEFINQLQIVLLNLGIVSRKNSVIRNLKYSANKYYYLSLGGESTDLFLKLVPNYSRKKDKLNLRDRHPGFDTIPYVNEIIARKRESLGHGADERLNGVPVKLTLPLNARSKEITYGVLDNHDDVVENYKNIDHDVYQTLNELQERRWFWDTVTSTSFVEDDVFVYDFEVGLENPTFVANGFVNHNTTAARMIATYVNCANRELDGPPCGECDFCVSMTKTPPEHPDYTEINAADTRGIDHVRDLIKGTKFKASTNKRIYILDECHMLTKQAAETLLKPLEEPSPSSVWILCTTERHKVSSTIASRCTKLNLQPVAPEDTAALLSSVCEKEDFSLDDDMLLKIARAAHGHPRDALSVLEVAQNTLSSGTEFTEDSITEVLEEIVGESSEATVGQFLLGVYSGSIKRASAALHDIESFEYFINTVLTLHEQTIRHLAKCEPNHYWMAWHKNVDAVLRDDDGSSLMKLGELLEINSALLECANMVKQYQVDGYHVVFHHMLKAVQVARNLGIHKRKG